MNKLKEYFLPLGHLPPPSKVPKEYREEYVTRRAEVRQQTDDWDFQIPPEESVPTMVYSEKGLQDNWGRQLLLPDNLKRKMAELCQYNVVVKVADNGIEENHSALKGDWWLPAANYTNNQNLVGKHGTHVAGIIAAKDFGILRPLIDTGRISMKNCKVLHDRNGSFSWLQNMVRSERVEDRRNSIQSIPTVYNESLGAATGLIDSIEKDHKSTSELNVVFVAASGNNNGNVNYPAISPYFLSTGALDRQLKRAGYSNYGKELTWAFPGSAINSTYPNNVYAVLTGTSMASPFATSIVAIALSRWGISAFATPLYQSVKAYLTKIANDLGAKGWDQYYGYGIVYINAILDTRPEKETAPPPPPTPPPGKGREVTITLPGPYVYPYMSESELAEGGIKGGAHVVVLQDLVIRGTTNDEDGRQIKKIAEDYLIRTGKLLVIPDGEGVVEVVQYIPRFMHFFTREKPIQLYIGRMEAVQNNIIYYYRHTDDNLGGIPGTLGGAREIQINTYNESKSKK